MLGLRDLRIVADRAHGLARTALAWARWPSPASAALFAARLVERRGPVLAGHCRDHGGFGGGGDGRVIGSLRVRGLYLAVVTFVFALTAQQYFYYPPLLLG